jgi:hypothetical protein
MDELMLMEYLRSKGMGNMSEQEFIHKFKEFMNKHGKTSYMRHSDDDWDYSDNMMYRRGMYPKRNQLSYADMYAEYPEYGAYSELNLEKPYSRFNRMHDVDYPSNSKMNMKNFREDHFNESYAKHVVSGMYHVEGSRKHVGEKFDMSKAKEVRERYRGLIPQDITIADIYVAINAQYHDYCELFTSWFGSNIEQKVIESAIVFWFKDVDFEGDNKLMYYFDVM